MVSFSQKNDDTSANSNLNTPYTHTEVTENTPWHTAAWLPMRVTSESQKWKDYFTLNEAWQ